MLSVCIGISSSPIGRFFLMKTCNCIQEVLARHCSVLAALQLQRRFHAFCVFHCHTYASSAIPCQNCAYVVTLQFAALHLRRRYISSAYIITYWQTHVSSAEMMWRVVSGIESSSRGHRSRGKKPSQEAGHTNMHLGPNVGSWSSSHVRSNHTSIGARGDRGFDCIH